VCIEKAIGLDEAGAGPVFVSARVASASGALRGARAHTLAARRHVAQTTLGDALHPKSASTANEPSPSSHEIIFSCLRDLRCLAREEDVLLVECFLGDDTSSPRAVQSSRHKCLARGVVSLKLVTTRSSTLVPVHQTLLRNSGAPAFVSVRRFDPSAANDAASVSVASPRASAPSVDALTVPCLDLDIAGVPPGLAAFQPRVSTSASGAAPVWPKRTKRIFFLRHGESRWNEARREMRLSEFAKFDHPLNDVGVRQACAVGIERSSWCRAAATKTKTNTETAWRVSFGEATRVFASPLTRAVQTAALLLYPHEEDLGMGRRFSSGGSVRHRKPFALLKSLREVKGTMGSFDTVGAARGDAILKRAAEKLREARGGGDGPGATPPGDANRPGEVDARHVDLAMRAFSRNVDLNDAFGQWWTSRDDVDSACEIEQRLDDAAETLRLDESDVCVLVGHSLWFQHFMRRLLRRSETCEESRRFATENKAWCETMTQKKIPNCAVVGFDVRFDETTGVPRVTDAAPSFLFGSGRREDIPSPESVVSSSARAREML
jgi:broad specificity phosphatase PhoE